MLQRVCALGFLAEGGLAVFGLLLRENLGSLLLEKLGSLLLEPLLLDQGGKWLLHLLLLQKEKLLTVFFEQALVLQLLLQLLLLQQLLLLLQLPFQHVVFGFHLLYLLLLRQCAVGTGAGGGGQRA